MTKRIAAIVFIFIATTVAWMILGSTIFARSNMFSSSLKERVSTIWGTQQTQRPPTAFYNRAIKRAVERQHADRMVTEYVDDKERIDLSLQSTDARVALSLGYRQKGLIWYSTYKVGFNGDYTFTNPSEKAEKLHIQFPFPAESAVYDDFKIVIDGKEMPVKVSAKTADAEVEVQPGATIHCAFGYKSQGLDDWTYRFGDDVQQVRNFSLVMRTDFRDIDFPDNTLAATEKKQIPGGWELKWQYTNLLSGFQIGMHMPEKLQPGPLAGEISYFAPVSLFFFFFLMFIITTLRGIDLHPMNYFFLAAAFFAFHLLMAYLVDHISIHAAFVICSAVSIFLVISYLRLVVGLRFAAVEAGLSQFVYLVLFSYAFFFKGFTGLAITIGAIVTLFVVMQMTGRINWTERFKEFEGK